MSTATLSPIGVEIPQLENGDHLSATEFLRRYEAMPDVKKAELIQGIVYMASPVRARDHGKPDQMLQGWLWVFTESTPGVEAYTNSTIRFGPDDVPQPDIMLCLLPERGGKSRTNAKGFVVGSPELVVEIAASSATYDMQEKLETYRRYGVQEYLLWLVQESKIVWMHLEDDEYRPLPTDGDGTIKSRVFPGLWLDVDALMKYDRAGVRAALERGTKSAEHTAFVK